MRSEYIFDEQLQHVYAALMPQNRLICQVAEATGLRIGDVVGLRTEALKQRMTVREQKTGKARRIYIPSGLYQAIEAQAGPQWVFEGRYGGPKTRQAVWKDLKRASKAFRLPQNVTPHSLRKKYAVELLRKYGDIERVRKALLHDSLSVTLLYALADLLLTRADGAADSGAKQSGGGPGGKAGGTQN